MEITEAEQTAHCSAVGITLPTDTVEWVQLIPSTVSINSFTAVLSHNFTAPGDYNVKFTAKNEIHDQLDVGVQSIIDMNCESPKVELLGKIYLFLFP